MDIELYYQEEGNGESFIFLHGNGENSSSFKKQIDYFNTTISFFTALKNVNFKLLAMIIVFLLVTSGTLFNSAKHLLPKEINKIIELIE